MLDASDIFAGLPLTIGTMRLEEATLPTVTLIAPFKGRMMAVADVLKAEIGMILPPAGHCGQSPSAKAYWRSPGQWLVWGAVDTGALKGMAAVADMSDAFGRLRLGGGAEVLARLVDLDIDTMQPGQVAHTALADIPATLIAENETYELIVPRSYARSAVKRLETAMHSVAARQNLG